MKFTGVIVYNWKELNSPCRLHILMTLKKKVVLKLSCSPWAVRAEKPSPKAFVSHQGREAPGMKKAEVEAVQTLLKALQFSGSS